MSVNDIFDVDNINNIDDNENGENDDNDDNGNINNDIKDLDMDTLCIKEQIEWFNDEYDKIEDKYENIKDLTLFLATCSGNISNMCLGKSLDDNSDGFVKSQAEIVNCMKNLELSMKKYNNVLAINSNFGHVCQQIQTIILYFWLNLVKNVICKAMVLV